MEEKNGLGEGGMEGERRGGWKKIERKREKEEEKQIGKEG